MKTRSDLSDGDIETLDVFSTFVTIHVTPTIDVHKGIIIDKSDVAKLFKHLRMSVSDLDLDG